MINKARAKQPKSRDKQALLLRHCQTYGMRDLTFSRYSYVTQGMQYDLNTLKAIGNMQKGAILVKSEGLSISSGYDQKPSTLDPKPGKDWKKLLSKITKLYTLKPVNADYADFRMDGSSLVIVKPTIYKFDNYYLFFGRLSNKGAIAKHNEADNNHE